MPRSRKVMRYNKVNKKNQRKKLNRKNRKSNKRSLKKRSFKKKPLKKRSLKNKLHRGGSNINSQQEGFLSTMGKSISNLFGKKKKDEYNFINNNEKDGLDEAEKMLIDYSNRKNMDKPTRPHTELKIVYDNQV